MTDTTTAAEAATTTCEQCEETIYLYCHSQAGPLKAYAWTTIPEDSADDQRNGTMCARHDDYPWVHRPTVTEAEYAELRKAAEKLGAEYGTALGSWAFDGNSEDEGVRQILAWIADGDPQWEIPAPLSGEFADNPLPRDILEDLGVDEDSDEAPDLLDAFEDGFYRAFEEEVVRSGRALLGLDSANTDRNTDGS